MTVRRRSVSRPDDALLDQITLFDLAMHPRPLWASNVRGSKPWNDGLRPGAHLRSSPKVVRALRSCNALH